MANQGTTTTKSTARSDGSPKRGSGTKKAADLGVRAKILDAFAAYMAEEGKAPRSVAKFCREIGIAEVVFYRHFPSMHVVEKAFWRDWMAGVIEAVESGAEWGEFTARERYLAFLFALMQSVAERRSLLLERFNDIAPLANPAALEGMRSEFLEFSRRLLDHGAASGEIAERRGLENVYPGVLYAHLRWVIDYHLKDESEEFERTDAFIEKTVRLAFDLFHAQAFDSAADLLRFLLPVNPWCSRTGKAN
jgi:AcrR family transcriptional regulator